MKTQILDHVKSKCLEKSTLISTTVFKHTENLVKAGFLTRTSFHGVTSWHLNNCVQQTKRQDITCTLQHLKSLQRWSPATCSPLA